MGSILVRNLDDDVIARLKLKAEQRGMSLEGFVRERLTETAAVSREEFVVLAAAIRARSRPAAMPADADIRAVREGEPDA